MYSSVRNSLQLFIESTGLSFAVHIHQSRKKKKDGMPMDRSSKTMNNQRRLTRLTTLEGGQIKYQVFAFTYIYTITSGSTPLLFPVAQKFTDPRVSVYSNHDSLKITVGKKSTT